jgi:hypothetical protein
MLIPVTIRSPLSTLNEEKIYINNKYISCIYTKEDGARVIMENGAVFDIIESAKYIITFNKSEKRIGGKFEDKYPIYDFKKEVTHGKR